MRLPCVVIRCLAAVLFGTISAFVTAAGVAQGQAPSLVQPWGLPPLPAGVGPIEKFADVSGTPQGQFLEGGAFDTQGNLWFVAIGSGWVSYLTPDGKLVPAFNCNPPPELGQTCEPQGTRWFEGRLYLTTRHRGILVYDPQTKEVKTVVYTYRNQLFKGPNDLDFDAEGNLFFTDPWGTGPGPNLTDQTGAVYQYPRDGSLRKIMDSGLFPNGIAVSPDNGLLAVGDFRGGRIWYSTFQNGPTMGCPQCPKDPSHSTFSSVKAGTFVPGNGGPDGMHYDVRGNLWAALAGLGGIIQINPRGVILGFVPIPNDDAATTNFAFGGADNQFIYFEGATSGTFWRFKAPYPGLIGPGGVRLPAQP
ncbi:MAG: SMP-30/gluconolactonase/LRE family protein [Alphaproteobacteria bacterium]|nr:SMP-30/gluconolactonase/LRE family protein [Alphaproteobacteria bacterium]